MRTKLSNLSNLSTRLYVAEAQPLPEITEKVNQAEGCQEFFHLFALRFLKAADVRVQVSYDDGILQWELVQCLLNI